MHRRDWILGLTLVLGSAACSSEPKWQLVDSRDGGFRVQMPNYPRQSVEKADSAYGKIDTYFTIAVFRGTTYAVIYVDYPVEALTSERQVLDFAVDGALYNTGGKLVEQREIEHKGFPGRAFLARNATGLPSWGRIFLAGRRLYQLTVSGLNRPEIEGNAQRFLESFELLQSIELSPAPSG